MAKNFPIRKSEFFLCNENLPLSTP